MKKKNIVILIVVIVSLGGIVFLRNLGINKRKYTTVKTAIVSIGSIKSYLSTTATIKSKNSKDYYALSGKVTSLNVKVGDNVKKGQVLATFDTGDASFDAAKSNQIKNSNTIIADFDGTITAVNIVLGQTASPAIVAITLQDLSSLQGTVAVGKYDIAKLSVGEIATFKNNGKTYNGKVASIDPAAKTTVSATGSEATIGVYVDVLDNPDGLKVGFDTDIDILLGQVDNALKIPIEAIETDKTGRDYLFIVKNKKAVETNVEIGLQSDTDAQVLKGLAVGDKVILNPGATIKNGTLVK